MFPYMHLIIGHVMNDDKCLANLSQAPHELFRLCLVRGPIFTLPTKRAYKQNTWWAFGPFFSFFFSFFPPFFFSCWRRLLNWHLTLTTHFFIYLKKKKEKRKRKKKEHSTFFVKEFGSSRMNVIKLFIITIFVAGK